MLIYVNALLQREKRFIYKYSRSKEHTSSLLKLQVYYNYLGDNAIILSKVGKNGKIILVFI